MGAQKNTVLGPVGGTLSVVRMELRYLAFCEAPAGWLRKEENLDALADAATPDIFYFQVGDEISECQQPEKFV